MSLERAPPHVRPRAGCARAHARRAQVLAAAEPLAARMKSVEPPVKVMGDLRRLQPQPSHAQRASLATTTSAETGTSALGELGGNPLCAGQGSSSCPKQQPWPCPGGGRGPHSLSYEPPGLGRGQSSIKPGGRESHTTRPQRLAQVDAFIRAINTRATAGERHRPRDRRSLARELRSAAPTRM